MILGIGTDIVEVSRIKKLLIRFPERFLSRCFHPSEIEKFYSLSKIRQPQFIAKRFAAKEALVKAFGTGFSNGIEMNQIAVMNNEAGQPSIYLAPKITAIFQRAHEPKFKIHLSLSDEINYAIAFVTVEKTT